MVTKTLDLPANADDVWAVVGDFNGLARWNAGVVRSDLSQEGKRRTLTLKVGGTVIEDLIDYDWAARRCSYSIVESAVPVDRHKATLSVIDRGPGRCTVHWACEFYPKDADLETVSAIFSAIFDRGLKQLEQMFRK
jgi:Polyketide cyclase / dehydrase and lipid transport